MKYCVAQSAVLKELQRLELYHCFLCPLSLETAPQKILLMILFEKEKKKNMFQSKWT